MSYPAEAEPDGNRLAPHHYLQGVWAAAVIAVAASSPALLLTAAVGAFGWYHTWATYPRTGATIALLGNAGILIAALTDPALGSITSTAAVLIVGLVAADDAVSHAFGVWTPLDWVWGEYIRRWVS